jgi:hypothetical protein
MSSEVRAMLEKVQIGGADPWCCYDAETYQLQDCVRQGISLRCVFAGDLGCFEEVRAISVGLRSAA